MTFDEFWEKEHSTRQWGKYPNEAFVRFLMGNYKNAPDRKAVKILEIGSGGGANIWFVGKEGFDTYGFDASPSGVKNSQKFLADEKVVAQVITADAEDIDTIFSGIEFDVIFDICTLCNMKLAESATIVDKSIKRLKKGGRFFSFTFAKGTWGDGLGKELTKNCFSNIPEGPLKGIGVVQLMALEDMEEWGKKFASYNIEEYGHTLDSRKKQVKYYLLTAQK